MPEFGELGAAWLVTSDEPHPSTLDALMTRFFFVPFLFQVSCGQLGNRPPTDFEGDNAGECSDAADNDRDGLFDCDDPDCSGSPDCPPVPLINITGLYEGSLDCTGIDIPTSIDFLHDESNPTSPVGTLTMTLPIETPTPTRDVIIIADFIVEVVATVDPERVAQIIPFDTRLVGVQNCTLDSLLLDDCTVIDGVVDVPEVRSAVLLPEAMFDGQNTLMINTNTCQGQVERPPT